MESKDHLFDESYKEVSRNRLPEVKEDKFDRIFRYYGEENGKVTLPEDLRKELDRWTFIRLLYGSWEPMSAMEIVRSVVKEFKVSESTAWRDLRNSKKLFAHLEKSNLEFERIVVIEQIKQLRAKAIKRGDLKTAAMCDGNLIKVGGYDKELEPPKRIVNVIVQPVFDPKLIGAEEIPDLDKQLQAFTRAKRKKEQEAAETEFTEYTEE